MTGSVKLALVALLLLAVTVARAEDAGAPRGRLEVPETIYNAGKVDAGVTVRHEFLLRNVGTAALSVDAKPG